MTHSRAAAAHADRVLILGTDGLRDANAPRAAVTMFAILHSDSATPCRRARDTWRGVLAQSRPHAAVGARAGARRRPGLMPSRSSTRPRSANSPEASRRCPAPPTSKCAGRAPDSTKRSSRGWPVTRTSRWPVPWWKSTPASGAATTRSPILGVDAFRAGAVTPALLPSASDPLDVLRPDAVFLSPAAAAWLSAGPGDAITVQAGLRDLRLTRRGIAQRTRLAALRRHGHCGRAGSFRARGPHHPRRSARSARRRCRSAALALAARTSSRGRHRTAAGTRGRGRAPVARLPRQPQRPGTRRAVHRRAAGILDAGADGRPPPSAFRAAARAGTPTPATASRCCSSRARWSASSVLCSDSAPAMVSRPRPCTSSAAI